MTNERVLIIDDDPYIRNGCAEFLRSVDYDVTAAESGEKGLEIMKTAPYFNLVITDFKMPGMDGMTVLKLIKESYPKTDVIMITAHGTIGNAVQAMKLGAYDYLPKTFDLDELDIVVKRCLEKQRLSAEVSELKELVNLYEASKAISSIMGLNELLELILRLVCDTLGADGGSIMLYEPQTNELVTKAALGDRKDVITGTRLALGERIAGYVAKEEEVVAIEGTLKDDPRFAHLEAFDDIGSGITVPLLRKGKLLGVINLNRREKDSAFSKREKNLLSIFVVEAAIAIENTYLFNGLEQEKEELNATFVGMADGAIVTDAQLNIFRCNHAAEELLGISQKENVGKNLAQLTAHLDPSIPWEEIQSQTDRKVSFELTRKKGKALFLGVLATKLFDQENNPIGQIMVLRNITDERRAEKLKMDFLTLISHKIKTPLTTINGFSTLLVEKSEGVDAQTKRALQSIKKQGDLLDVLVDKLLRFSLLISEYTKIDPEKVTLPVILERCLKELAIFTGTNNVEITIAPEVAALPAVWADHLRIIEAIGNVLENAVKFNDKEKKSIKISGRLFDERSIVLEIRDNGLGIPSEEQTKIFQKFYQIDEYFTGQIEGVGLGLALVKQIVELHGGKIWVESTLGEGSTFSIVLPVAQ